MQAEIVVLVSQGLLMENLVTQKLVRPCTRSMALYSAHANAADGTGFPKAHTTRSHKDATEYPASYNIRTGLKQDMEYIIYSSDEDDDEEEDDDNDDEGKDSGSDSNDGSLNSLPSMIKACGKVEKEATDADYSAFAGHFGAFLKLMGKD